MNGAKVSDLVNDKLASIGEKIGITNLNALKPLRGFLYSRRPTVSGVLVGLDKTAAEAGKDVAMQIAALNPVAVDANQRSAEVITRERDRPGTTEK